MAEAVKAQAAETPFRRPFRKALLESDFELNVAGQVSQLWRANISPSISPADVLEPDFWKHVARRVVTTDRIEAWAKDGTWMGEYVVLFKTEHELRLFEIARRELPTGKVDTSAAVYFTEWISPPLRWGIRRKSDNEIIKSGFETKEQAVVWMQEHRKSMGV